MHLEIASFICSSMSTLGAARSWKPAEQQRMRSRLPGVRCRSLAGQVGAIVVLKENGADSLRSELPPAERVASGSPPEGGPVVCMSRPQEVRGFPSGSKSVSGSRSKSFSGFSSTTPIPRAIPTPNAIIQDQGREDPGADGRYCKGATHPQRFGKLATVCQSPDSLPPSPVCAHPDQSAR